MFLFICICFFFNIGKFVNRKSLLHIILQQQLATFTHLCKDFHLRCHLLRGSHSHSTSYACGGYLRFSILHKGTLKCTCQRSDNLSFKWWLATLSSEPLLHIYYDD